MGPDLTFHGLRHTVGTLLVEFRRRTRHRPPMAWPEDFGYGDSLFRRRGYVPADERGRAEIRSTGEQKGNMECANSPIAMSNHKFVMFVRVDSIGERDGTRTLDPLIKSQLLQFHVSSVFLSTSVRNGALLCVTRVRLDALSSGAPLAFAPLRGRAGDSECCREHRRRG